MNAPNATPSQCELRPSIGLCDECGQPKWPQEYAGYGAMLCLDCLAAEAKTARESGLQISTAISTTAAIKPLKNSQNRSKPSGALKSPTTNIH